MAAQSSKPGKPATSDLRQRAIRLLARREHSKVELARKLGAFGTHDEINALLTELEAANLQSDLRFAEGYVRFNASRLGASRLRQTLRTKGIGAELVDMQLEGQLGPAGQGDESARALDVWTRRFGNAPTTAQEWAKQARFLQYRGFPTEVIRKLLGALPERLRENRSSNGRLTLHPEGTESA